MLDRISPEQFDEWVAYRRLEAEWQERMIEILKRGFALLARSWGAKVEPDDFDIQARRAEMTPEQASQIFRGAVSGLGNR